MADTKTSNLPAATALTGAELVPVVQGGATKQSTTQAIADLAASGTTDLSVTRTSTAVTVASSTGTDATLAAADASNAGVMTAAQAIKLAGLPSSADAAGTAATAVSAHAGASDPHGDRAYAAAQDAAHVAASDPHAQYVLESTIGAAGGVAPLDGTSKVAAVYLPSYVDDVIEAANFAALPGTGESGKIYVTIDSGKTWRWGGSAYAEISASPGSTDAVTEGATNLYFTVARVRAAVLTGLSLATAAAIDAADTVLAALGKLQAQITANLSTLTGHTSNTSNPHGVTLAQVGGAASGAVTASGLTMGTAKLLGRSTASTGGVEELTVGSGLSLGGGTLTATGGGGTPGGSSGAVQGNTSGAFAAIPGLMYNTTTGALTYDGGTVTADTPMLTLQQNWNNGAVNFTGLTIKGIGANVASPQYFQIYGGSTPNRIFSVGWNGATVIGGTLDIVGAMQIGSAPTGSVLNFGQGSGFRTTDTTSVNLRDGTNSAYSDLRLRSLIGVGGLATGVVAKTSSYTATTSDHTITVDASGGAVTITGFACASNAGKRLTIKKTDSSGNAVTFDPNASETVDGASSKAVSTQYAGFTVQVNEAATAWCVVATF